MSNEYDDEKLEDDLSEAELVFARLLAGNTSIDEAVERACKAQPELEAELTEQLARYMERRKKRLGKTEKGKETGQNPEGLAEMLLDRYSDHLSITPSYGGDSSTPLIPEQGRYRIQEEIARGGMGVILQALDPVLQRQVAMKVILGNSDGVAPSQRTQRFIREAKITAQLTHPGIVAVHDLSCAEDGRFFFTMDRIEGQELRDVMIAFRDGDPDWDLNRLLETFLKICDTMEFAHDRGVVHRDLKPSNIMVGKFGETYVMDWGLARKVDDQEDDPIHGKIEDRGDTSPDGSTIVTRDGAVVGTPSYMSPEQALPDTGKIGPWTDVYALGSLLYEILTGYAPYRSANSGPMPAHRVLRKLKEGPPADILELAPDTPEDLAEICRQAMSRDWEQRPPSAGTVSALIREIQNSRARDAKATREALEIAKRSRAVTQFLTDLFIEPGQERTSLHRIDAQDLLDRGANQLVDGGPEQPEIRVTLLATMASVLLQTGSPERAALLLENEKEIRGKHPHWPGEDYVRTLRQLSFAQIQVRRLSQAEETLQEALDQPVLQSDIDLFTSVQLELALLLNLRGDWFRAEEFHSDLLLNLKNSPGTRALTGLLGLARSFSYQGDWKEAEKTLAKAEETSRDLRSVERAECLFQMAGLHLECEREEVEDEQLELAKTHLEEAIRIQIEVSGEKSSITARYQRALACCLQRLGQVKEAEQIAREALVSVRQTHVIQHPLCARSFARLASILLRSGQSDVAEKLLAEAGTSLDLMEVRPEHEFDALEAKARLLSLSSKWEEARKILLELDEIGDELPTMHQYRRSNIESICRDAGIAPQLSDQANE
ncbi:MAG: serine/threonine protein kinase [Planctomycetes bacterium]|nr:serine/threonine protein kinase [Planctomycetota bacterium]